MQKKYLCEKDFFEFDDSADVYFSGSDQVWNTGWNHGVIPPFYLSFVPDEKARYAYASSFGMTFLDLKDVAASQSYIRRFQKISVREKSGIDILKQQYGFENVIRILDPTLTMPAEFWRKRAPAPKIKEKYILIYNLNRSREFDEYAAELSKRTGLPLYRLCTRFDQVLRNGKSIIIPEIFKFVTLIDHADMVLTDSFHATAFSMNLETEPVCVYPTDYAGRISEFLKLVRSEQRRVINYQDFDILNRPVDFGQVQRILLQERKRVDEYLSEIVREVQ